MRTYIAITAAAAAVVLPLQLALAGDESPSPRAAQSSDAPVHQIAGDWRAGRTLRLRLSVREGVVQGRAVRAGRVGGCRVRRGALLVRELAYIGRDAAGADRWEGVSNWPSSGCRRPSRRAVVTQRGELRLELRPGAATPVKLRRVRPPVRATDPVIGAWERNRAGVVVEREDDRYVGRAREAFLIANGCTVPAGTVVWRLRPVAPDRYDGVTQTFAAPPECEAANTAPSTWRLTAERTRLVRRGPDGAEVEYERSR